MVDIFFKMKISISKPLNTYTLKKFPLIENILWYTRSLSKVLNSRIFPTKKMIDLCENAKNAIFALRLGVAEEESSSETESSSESESGSE